MRNGNATLLLTLFGFLALGSCKSLSALSSPSTLATLKRKPFVSPYRTAPVEDCMRTKRQTRTNNAQQFQDTLKIAKETCAAAMGFQPNEVEKSLLYEERPTPKEKCLIECILKRMKIMDSANKISTRTIGRIAEMISNNNALVVSIAMVTADNCNRQVNDPAPCEAAYQINKCMANEMRVHKVKIFY